MSASFLLNKYKIASPTFLTPLPVAGCELRWPVDKKKCRQKSHLPYVVPNKRKPNPSYFLVVFILMSVKTRARVIGLRFAEGKNWAHAVIGRMQAGHVMLSGAFSQMWLAPNPISGKTFRLIR